MIFNFFKKTEENNQIDKAYNREELMSYLSSLLPKNLYTDDVFIVCIGTDKSTGDALGPIVGSILEKKGYQNIIGTLEKPFHGLNIRNRIEEIPKDKKVIAIDACLSKISSVGSYTLYRGSIFPGSAFNSNYPKIGDYSILGVVNEDCGVDSMNKLNQTRLFLTYSMAEDIVSVITRLLPPSINKDN